MEALQDQEAQKRRNWSVSQSFTSHFNLRFHLSLAERFTEVTYRNERNEQSTARSGRSGSHGPSTNRQASVRAVQKNVAYLETLKQAQNFSFTVYFQYCSTRQSLRTLYLQCSIFAYLQHRLCQRHCVTDRLTSGISTLMALRCRSAIPKPHRTSWVQCQVGCKTIHNSQCLVMFRSVYVCFCRVFEDFDM